MKHRFFIVAVLLCLVLSLFVGIGCEESDDEVGQTFPCPSCGFMLEEGANFCPNCGYELTDSDTTPSTTEPTATTETIATTEPTVTTEPSETTEPGKPTYTFLQFNCSGAGCYVFEESYVIQGETDSVDGVWQQVSSGGMYVSDNWDATWTFSENTARYDFIPSGCYKTFSPAIFHDDGTYELHVTADTCGNDVGKIYSGTYLLTNDTLDIANYVDSEITVLKDRDNPEFAFALKDNVYIFTIQIGNEVGLAEYGSHVVESGNHFFFPEWKLQGELTVRAAEPVAESDDCAMVLVTTGNLLYDQSCQDYQVSTTGYAGQELPLSFYKAVANIMHLGELSDDTSSSGSSSSGTSQSSQRDLDRVITQNQNTYDAYGYAGFFNSW